MIALQKEHEAPITYSGQNHKLRLKAKQEYYESKIEVLERMNMPIKLILLACWDAPVERDNLSTKWGRKRFVKRCIKFYKKKLKEIEHERKVLNIK
jgi:hypothetical protein